MLHLFMENSTPLLPFWFHVLRYRYYRLLRYLVVPDSLPLAFWFTTNHVNSTSADFWSRVPTIHVFDTYVDFYISVIYNSHSRYLTISLLWFYRYHVSVVMHSIPPLRYVPHVVPTIYTVTFWWYFYDFNLFYVHDFSLVHSPARSFPHTIRYVLFWSYSGDSSHHTTFCHVVPFLLPFVWFCRFHYVWIFYLPRSFRHTAMRFFVPFTTHSAFRLPACHVPHRSCTLPIAIYRYRYGVRLFTNLPAVYWELLPRYRIWTYAFPTTGVTRYTDYLLCSSAVTDQTLHLNYFGRSTTCVARYLPVVIYWRFSCVLPFVLPLLTFRVLLPFVLRSIHSRSLLHVVEGVRLFCCCYRTFLFHLR